jgi:uncharacterized protein YdeI (YjbR/CyaY-like superfamily)
MDPVFFATPAEFRAWLEEHHESETELLVGFYRTSTGRPSITWPESVDEALCFGWIDGVRRSRDADSYTIRFTPRKPTSTWSTVNIARVADLTGQGRMRPAGLAAFERRSAKRSSIYAYEQAAPPGLTAAEEAQFQADAGAWEFFGTQAPSYRKTVVHWVSSAKRPETRERRLATLIAESAAGRRVSQFTSRRVAP